MTLTEKIKEAIEKGFDENNKEIIGHDDSYAFAKQFVQTFSDEKMKEYQEKVPDVVETLREAKKKKKKEVTSRLKGLKLDVEMVLNRNNDGVEIYVPARYANGTDLEKDLVGHVVSIFGEYASHVRIGRFGPYVAVTGNVERKDSDLKEWLEADSEAMAMSHIDLKAHEVMIPVEGKYSSKLVVIPMTPSAIRYKLIPVHQTNRKFFPRYKEPFEIITPQGTITAQVTSKTPTPGRGNYICSIGDGSLGNFIKESGLKPGDKVEIAEIKPKKKYSMTKV